MENVVRLKLLEADKKLKTCSESAIMLTLNSKLNIQQASLIKEYSSWKKF